jgi:hypothetical protein
MTAQRKIQIIDLKNAHLDIIERMPLKDEIDTINGISAISYIPIEGAVFLNDFKEEGQFKASPLSITFNDSETTFIVPVEFQGICGRTPNEETLYNFDRQVLHCPVPLNKKILPNTTVKVKYRDNLSLYRFKYNIKLILDYIEK